jgi:hypothetical protein
LHAILTFTIVKTFSGSGKVEVSGGLGLWRGFDERAEILTSFNLAKLMFLSCFAGQMAKQRGLLKVIM